MALNYSILETLVVPGGATVSTPESGFGKIYPRDDYYWYQLDVYDIERRLGLDLLLSCGLTYSSILDNGIAPYGAVLSLTLGPGMTFSNCQVVVDYITASQISTNNSPNPGDVLSFNGSEMTWVPSISINDIATLFGIDCGLGFTPSGTASYEGGSYSLQIVCV